MDVSVVRPAELGPHDLARWRAVQAGDERLGSPFLSPEFTRLVGAVRRHARVAVLHDGATTGYFPFERNRPGLGRPIGMGAADCEGLVVDELRVDGPTLLRACGLAVWRFHHLVSHQAAILAPAAAEVMSPIIGLEGGYEHYLAERKLASKTLLESTARKARKLEREIGDVRFVYDQPDHALLDQLVRWKRSQYRAGGVPDALARPEICELLHRLLDTRGKTFGAVLSVLLAGERPIAIHMGLRSATGLAWWIPAYDSRYASYSPGVILTLRVTESASGQGMAWIDLGKGDEQYKQRLKSRDLRLADGLLCRAFSRRPYELLQRAHRGVRANGRTTAKLESTPR